MDGVLRLLVLVAATTLTVHVPLGAHDVRDSDTDTVTAKLCVERYG